MLPILSVLNNFPFVGVHRCIDIYVVSQIELLLSLSIGISKLLKRCLFMYLSYKSQKFYCHAMSFLLFKSFSRYSKSSSEIVTYDFKRYWEIWVEIWSSTWFLEWRDWRQSCWIVHSMGVLTMLKAKDHDHINVFPPLFQKLLGFAVVTQSVL